MQQLGEGFSSEEHQKIEEQGLKVHTSQQLSSWHNPHHKDYWMVNGGMLGALGYARHFAQKNSRPTLVYSVAICAIPFFALMTTSKLDKRRDYYQHRKTLEERLEYHPITRNAMQTALKMNEEYQTHLRQEIAQLKAKLQ